MPFALDLGTVHTLIIAASLVVSIGALAAARSYPSHVRFGLHLWGISAALQALTYLLLTLRGMVPDGLSIVVANTVSTLSGALAYAAIRALHQRRIPKDQITALVIAALGAYSLTMGADMISRRIIIVSVFKLIIYGLVIHELLRAARERDRRIHDLTIGTYAIAALVFLVRLIDAARPSTPEWEPLTPDVVQQLTFLTVFLTTFAASMLYVLMAGQEVNGQLYRLATFDGLTGIYNRRAFEQLARKELSRGNRSGALPALIIFDIDDFKGINERLGHVTGDQVLREVIDSIQSALRQQDILGRWGGDEFCALLPETSLETARAVAERLRERVVQTPLEHHGQRLQLTVSAGLAAAVRHDGSFTALVGRAGQALHEAKRSGRNRTCVAPQAEPPLKPD